MEALLFEEFGAMSAGVEELLMRVAEVAGRKLTWWQYDQTSWSAREWMPFALQRLSVQLFSHANYLPNPREQASQPPGFARQTSAVASGTPSYTNGQPALVTVRRIQGPVSRKEWHVSSAPHARGTPQCSRSEP